ncbi:MAG: DUF2807 domain-containing protein [Oscillospiraceae bacterium]|jgi:hypothetical protein|nr:DUF2807 domain-containing protein [Oscillospiraceae bacterium]
MKKILLSVLCIVLSAVLLSGCVTVDLRYSIMRGASPGGISVTGTGAQEDFTFDVSQLTSVTISMFCNIEIYSAPSDTITLRIQPNLMEYIEVNESGGILDVWSTRNINTTSPNNIPVLTISTPSLSRLTLNGAGKFTVHDTITGDSLTINMNGAVDGTAKMDVDNFTVSLAGASDMTFSGRADTANFSIAGAGNISALSLQTRDSAVNIAGAGTVRINCTDNLKVSAGGVGSVEYTGSPKLDISRGGLVSVKNVE